MPFMNPEEVLEELRRRAEHVRTQFKHSVRGIYRRHRTGQPELIGSSVVLEIGKQPCLATAAHVLHSADGGSLWMGGSSRLIQLRTPFDSTSPEDTKDDVDVAVAPLSGPELDELVGVPIIGRSDQLREPAADPDDFFLVMGYRASQNKPEQPGTKVLKKRTQRTFMGNGTEVPKATDRSHNGAHNFGIEYTKFGYRADGAKVKSTPPEGVSGGAIFHLGNVQCIQQLGAAASQGPKLVGLLIECRGAVLIGTSLSMVYYVRSQSDPSVA
jgi:hypothetical protein